MKQFFISFFASCLALALFCGLLIVVTVVGIGVAASGVKWTKPASKIEKGAYLVFDMSVNITDAPAASEGEQALGKLLGGSDTHVLSLRPMLESLAAAAKDDNIAGIFLYGSFKPVNYGAGYAALKEVREALLSFKATGKPILAYLVAPTTRDYYLASVADEIYLNPFGEMAIPGLASQPIFFANAFQKYGIGVQVTRVGKYKSAVEPFTREQLSPEAREESQKLLDDVWHDFLAAVEATRKIPAAQFQALVDAHALIDPDTALANKLVTKKAYLPEAIEELRKRTGSSGDADEKSPFKQVSLAGYIAQKTNPEREAEAKNRLAGATDSTPKVAIVYAEGEIVDGESTSNTLIAGERFARELRKVRRDDSVKAVVLRVNSPGGSALASELIQRELLLLREAGKPVIVSMGAVAASGGYWISTASDRIFAEPNTITGSIGVFGILPNIQKLANDHGVTFDNVETARHADLFNVSRPKTDEELKIIQDIIDRIYANFIERVSKARNIPAAKVEEIAQGRVWSGEDGKRLGLVDEIGGLQAALAYAKEKVKLPADAKIAEYPAQKDFSEQLAEIFGGEKKPLSAVEAYLQQAQAGGAGAAGDPLTREFQNVESELMKLR
ncbi:MAG: signal peptide peptidase SppA, partial [Verrucomicrobia bacterium]|nr:signal peptide peptidase SppA [Verrucomicrobiota bacterium]